AGSVFRLLATREAPMLAAHQHSWLCSTEMTQQHQSVSYKCTRVIPADLSADPSSLFYVNYLCARRPACGIAAGSTTAQPHARRSPRSRVRAREFACAVESYSPLGRYVAPAPALRAASPGTGGAAFACITT